MTRNQLAESVVWHTTKEVLKRNYYGHQFWLDDLKDEIRLFVLTDKVDRPIGYYYKKAMWMAKNKLAESNTLKRKANFHVTYTNEAAEKLRLLEAFRLRAELELGEELASQLMTLLASDKPTKTQLTLLQTQQIRDFLEEEVI